MNAHVDQIQAILNSAIATAWERAFADGLLKHLARGAQLTEKQVATLAKVESQVMSRFSSRSVPLTGQNKRDGTHARA